MLVIFMRISVYTYFTVLGKPTISCILLALFDLLVILRVFSVTL